MNKRWIAALLAAAMLFSMAAALSGCAQGETNRGTTTSDKVKLGAWLRSINETFGMIYYQQETPFFANISTGHEYFADVQTAAEWDVVDRTAEKLSIDADVTLEQAAITLVNAARLAGEDAADADKVDIAREKGILPAGSGDSLSKKLTQAQGELMLETAHGLWLNKTYDEEIINYDLLEAVTDLSESGITAGDLSIDATGAQLDIPLAQLPEIKAGEFVVVPDEQTGLATAYEVAEIQEADGRAVIRLNSEGLAFEDVFEELQIQTTFRASLAGSRVVDGAGNVLTWDGGATASQGTASGMPRATQLGGSAALSPTQTAAAQTANFKFEIDGLAVSGSVTDNGVSFSVEGELKGFGSNTKLKIKKGFEISDMTATLDYDYSWFTLHQAATRISYKTKETFGGVIEYKNGHTFIGDDFKSEDKDGTVDLEAMRQAVLNFSKMEGPSKDGKSITIVSVPLVGGGVAGINVEVRLKFKASGSVEVVVTTSQTYGVEYIKNNGVRFIAEKKEDMDLVVKGKVEVTLYAGVVAHALGFKLIGFGAEGGIGFEASMTLHLVDTEQSVELGQFQVDGDGALVDECVSEFNSSAVAKLEACCDLSLYGIVKVGVDMSTVAGQILDGTGVKVTLTLYDKKNATFWTRHYEDWHQVGECTRKYRASKDDADADTTTTDPDATGANEMERLDISLYSISLLAGESESIQVTGLPTGYTEADIQFKSDNPGVATVSAAGRVTGVSDGSVIITVSTSDGAYVVQCSVTVSVPSTIKVDPLSAVEPVEAEERLPVYAAV